MGVSKRYFSYSYQPIFNQSYGKYVSDPIVDRNGSNFGSGLVVLGITYVGAFHVWFVEFILAHSLHFAKFPMLRVSKQYCSHRFHPFTTQLMESVVLGGGGGKELFYFLSICQDWKKCGTLKYWVSHLICKAIIRHKPILASSGQSSSRTLRPMSLFFECQQKFLL